MNAHLVRLREALSRFHAASDSRLHLGVILILGVLCMAPTVGDVGGCGKEPTPLDPQTFAEARKDQDCERCQECNLTAPRCIRACDAGAPPDTAIPATCLPLFHDGEVCLRALHAASCSSYETYVDEIAPAIPSECEFCKVTPPAAPPGFTVGENDAGVVPPTTSDASAASDASVDGGP